MALRVTKEDERRGNVAWRGHSSLPHRHSCRRLGERNSEGSMADSLLCPLCTELNVPHPDAWAARGCTRSLTAAAQSHNRALWSRLTYAGAAWKRDLRRSGGDNPCNTLRRS